MSTSSKITTVKKDAVYARQSLDKKDSLSIEAQIDKGLSFAENGAEIYSDKGFSGKNTDRPDLKRLKEDIELDKIKRVFVYRLDRISRNISDFYNLYQTMKNHDCEFISISENFDTSTPMGRAMMGILIVFAQMERESIQERVKDNYYYRISEDGRWPGGPAPLGFKNARTPDNKPTLVPAADVNMVKKAFEMYGKDPNTSLGQVAIKLYDLGYKSERTNGRFDNTTVRRMLQNPAYAVADKALYRFYISRKAQIESKEEEWDGSTSAYLVGKRDRGGSVNKYTSLDKQHVYRTNFPGIISSSLFISVQERLKLNKQIRRSNSPGKLKELSGLVKCANCGYTIKVNAYPYLNCYGRTSLHCCDVKFKIKVDDLIEKVAVEVQKQLDVIAVKFLTDEDEAHKAIKEIEQLNKEIDNLVNLAALGLGDLPNVKSQIEERRQKIAEIELAQEHKLTFMQRAKISESLPIVYKRYSDDQKKNILNLLIERINVSANGDLEIIWKI